jgi:hypothetical protein
MPDRVKVCIVYNTSNVFGLEKDAAILQNALPLVFKQLGQAVPIIQLADCRESPVRCDICIHLEVPYAVWFPWSTCTIMLVNSEWWLEDKWSSYWNQITIALFRKGTPLLSNQAAHTYTIPWCSSLSNKAPVLPDKRARGFVWFLGGSVNKRHAAEVILPLWKPSYPPVTVYCLEPLSADLLLASNVTIQVGMMTVEKRKEVSAGSFGHICISKAESFGYTASEAEEVGAFTILNTIPAYTVNYTEPAGLAWIPTSVDSNGIAEFSDTYALEVGLDTAIQQFQQLSDAELSTLASRRQSTYLARASTFISSFKIPINTCLSLLSDSSQYSMPPILLPADCPSISIITLVHNRPKFIENACLNILHSDYPHTKIEWVVVDDSDPTESASNRIIQFGERFTDGVVTYIPLPKQRSIGYKRNLGVERAKHDIILMMDDDDVYPVTSFRRRVAYLLKGPRAYDCGVCTTIAMYDLLQGISAVNVPPYTLSLAERCSEATLTFRRRFWLEGKFPDSSMAEGEGFLTGRESQVVEFPPQQMIVALSHGSNLSKRKIPDSTPGCFWGFSKELLVFLHGLVGVTVESAE